MQEIYQQSKQMQAELVEIRRQLHQNPEVGANLPHTRDFVKAKLEEYGYIPQDIGNSSVTAEIAGNGSGKTILLRADMDALAVQEAADIDFKSQNGAMHGCGHDMHTTMLLGAAKLLQQNRDKLQGTVKLLFQEDEEGFTGAKSVIREGVLEQPKVDAAMALHVNSGTPSQMVLCGLGHFMAGCTLFKIEVQGTGCHGAMPETGIDPINIASHIYLSLQNLLRARWLPRIPACLQSGSFPEARNRTLFLKKSYWKAQSDTRIRKPASVFTKESEKLRRIPLMPLAERHSSRKRQALLLSSTMMKWYVK